MAKFHGLNRINTSVFISGTGSNLNNLIKFSLRPNSPIKINLVISDNSKAKGLIFCEKYKIKSKIYNFKNSLKAENMIIKDLKRNKIKLICLAGFMKILSKKFIQAFSGKILNIHPSLLPKYKGLNTHEKAIKNKEKFSGCTVHYVNSKLDAGKIILQKKVRIKKNDNSKSLAKNILKQEHILYPKAILKILSSL